MSLAGVKTNKCFSYGVQGVCNTITEENTTGQSAIFSINPTENNTLYVLKEYTRGLFGLLPENPTGDFNFKVTLQRASGFTVPLASLVMFYNVNTTTGSGDPITIKWDNPDFDVTNNYTVIHMYIWYDGINYCGRVDGY